MGQVAWSLYTESDELFIKDVILRIRAMHEANTALLDILVDNSVIIPPFQNRTSTFVGFEKDGVLAELQARTSRSRRFCCFLPHT